MTEKEKKDNMSEAASADEVVAETAESAENAFEAQDMERLLKAISEKSKLQDELNDRLKRLQADFDNFRRRTRQEKEELSGVVTENIILQLLPVIDNFERAIANAPQSDAETLRSGIEMIFRQLSAALEQMGLAPIIAEGQLFDPQYHDAVMRLEDPEQPDGLIVQELQKGYLVRTKVIRPSMVKVVGNS